MAVFAKCEKIRQVRWVIGFSLVAIGIGIVVASMLPSSTHYYLTVDELVSQRTRFQDKQLKIAGKVVGGSIAQDSHALSWTFRIENAGHAISVRYKGSLPDTCKDGAEVVVTGMLDGSERFQATHVLAKCASRYQEKLRTSDTRW